MILLAGAAANDRDGAVAGVPILGQLAGALADAGFVAVRYDKRGYGQSGGRAESATMSDYADDALAVFSWLANRRDIDRDRIAVIGHNEGAWMALLAATRERDIAGVVTLAAPATTGKERVVEQQRHVLERMQLAPADRVARIAAAGKNQRRGDDRKRMGGHSRRHAQAGRYAVVPELPGVRAGTRHQGYPSAAADRSRRARRRSSRRRTWIALAELAKASRSRAVAVVSVRDVNHLLIPAVRGEVDEYATLKDRDLSKDVTTAITSWLTKTFQAVR